MAVISLMSVLCAPTYGQSSPEEQAVTEGFLVHVNFQHADSKDVKPPCKMLEIAKATPPKDLTDTFGPKATYCVSCEREDKTKSILSRENAIVVVNQNGSLVFLDKITMMPLIYAQCLRQAAADSPDVMIRAEAFLEFEKQFKALWGKSCPFVLRH